MVAVGSGPAGGPQVEVSVTDTGVGIARADHGKLFEPFSQVDAAPTRKTGGSGLGLAISRQLVEMHGGQIWVESELGQGSTFTFSLPLEQGVDVSPEPASALPPAPPGPVILAVDDNPGAIALYQRYLQPHGYVVTGLTDSRGANVVNAARSLRPRAILLDVVMPHKDGWQVLSDLKSEDATRGIPVVVCTISAERDRALDMGAASYLVKPFVEADLCEVLGQVNGG
jgi:CheY-like chemotaxis protein